MSPTPETTRTELLNIRNGDSARVAEILGGNQMVRRMLSLGIRVGTVVNVLNHRGKGLVVGNAGCRVALGADIAAGHRCVQCAGLHVAGTLGYLGGQAGWCRSHIHDDTACAQAGENALFAEINLHPGIADLDDVSVM